MQLCLVKWYPICLISGKVFDFIEGNLGQMDTGSGFVFDLDDLPHLRKEAEGDKEILDTLKELERTAKKNGNTIELEVA